VFGYHVFCCAECRYTGCSFVSCHYTAFSYNQSYCAEVHNVELCLVSV
jgi:hypothetical protein